MRLEIVVALLVLFTGVYTESPIEITEGEGTLPKQYLSSFDCSGVPNFKTYGIAKSYFRIVSNPNGTTSVYLNKTIDLNKDFPYVKRGCLNETSQKNITIVFTCDENVEASHPVIIIPRKAQGAYICNTSCNNFTNPLELKIPENTTVQTILLNYSTCSKDVYWDSQSVEQAQLNGSSALTDGSNKGNGEIILKKRLDFEKPISINSTLTIGKEVINIRAVIVDSDDLGIEFTNTSYTCKVHENFVGPAKECVVAATDLDKGINETVLYSIVSVTPNAPGMFTIDQNGTLIVHNHLDREKQAFYHFLIKGYQKDKPHNNDKTSYTTLQLTVKDRNDNAPVILRLLNEYSVVENSPIGTIVCQLSATDIDQAADKNPTDQLEFTLQNFTDNPFTIVNNTMLRINKPLDRETTESYNLKISVNDSLHVVTTNVQVRIVDVNDNTPIFTGHKLNSVREEIANETVGNVSVTDTDSGKNGEVDFSIDERLPWAQNFTISPSGNFCNITTKGPIDREQLGNGTIIRLVIIVKDRGIPPRMNSILLNINITDENDHVPMFIGVANPQFTVKEDAPINSNVFQVQTTDPDLGSNRRVYYSILNSNVQANEFFSINESTGIISVKKTPSLDILNSSTIKFVIVASNKPTRKSNITIICNIEDVNNNIPKFNNTTYLKNVSECTKTGSLVASVSATDADITQEFKTVSYWLEDNNNNNDTFFIDSKTGHIYLVKELDYDPPNNQKRLSFKVYATDSLVRGNPHSNHTTSANVTIIVTGCNDSPPVFQQDDVTCLLPENRNGTFNCTVNASDNDGDILTYSLISSKTKFKVNSRNGAVSSVQPFDYDSMESHVIQLNISAKDTNHTSYVSVRVEVTDLNDEPPIFWGENTFDVQEGALIDNYLVGIVSVTDKDSETVGLSLQNCTDILNITTKGIILGISKFDYEQIQELNCSILATDTANTANATIKVNVIDINDNYPVFTNNTCGNASESLMKGQHICKITAKDDDKSSSFNIISYTIFSGNLDGVLNINDQTGEIKTAKDLAGFGGQKLLLSIKAADNGSPPLVSFSNVTIVITNENLNPPKFVNTPYLASVRENQQNIEVLQVTARDVDEDQLQYDVLNATDKFYFNNSNLMVKNVDAEKTNGKVYVRISVSDGTYNDSTVVAVNVIDENDNVPYFATQTNSCNTTLADFSPEDTSVCKVTAIDKDISNSGFTYILTGGNGDFSINRTNGEVRLINDFGRNGLSYNMHVVVVDNGAPPKYSSTVITVNVNETNARFSYKPTTSINFPENTANVNSSIAVDYPNANISYKIISDNKIDILKVFKLDPHTALLTLADKSNLLDYEAQSSFSFTVLAKDNGVFPQSATTNVTVNVNDINESPNITQFDRIVYVEENTSKGKIISKIEAIDPDKNKTFKQLSYTLSDTTIFKIGNDGTIDVKATQLPAGNYTVNVTVTDGGGLSDSKDMYIIVPKIITGIANEAVTENKTNIDITVFISPVKKFEVQYSLIPSIYSGYFNLYMNGSLKLVKELDRESVDVVHLEVIGRDKDHEVLIKRIQVNINVTDVNDCPPEFLQQQYMINVDDVTKNGTTIARLDVIDRDVDADNRNLTFSSDSDTFGIDSFGNLILTSALSPGEETFSVTVTDGRFKNNAKVIVNITDTNDHSPEFQVATYIFSIVETNNTNVTIGNVIRAHDADLGDNGRISFSLMNDKNLPFRILNMDNNSCIVKTSKKIDRELNTTYRLNIRATDSGKTPRQAIQAVEVHVLDVNDNSPTFSGSAVFNGSVVENSINKTQVKLNSPIDVYDPDSGLNGTAGLVYKLNDTGGPFCIYNTTPTIYVCGEIDRETKDMFYLQIIVQDSEGRHGSLSQTAPLTIQALDENDETPKFTKNYYEFETPENAVLPTAIGNVSATDDDIGNVLIYNIVSGDDGMFYINQITGMIYVGGNIDRETQSKYSLNISVFDGAHINFTNVNVSVTDVNDNAPKFTMLASEGKFTVEVVESITDGIILNATALDEDETGSNNSKVAYMFTVSPSGYESAFFNITENGSIYLTKALNREVMNAYDLNITATDQGTPALSTSLLVHVNVLDINDNRPEICVEGQCNVNTINCYTVEKVPKYSVLKLIEANDADAGINATITYSIEPSDVSRYFKIDNATGVVLIAEPLIVNNLIHEGFAESGDTVMVNLTIVATDGGGLNASLILHVYVEPLNDDDVPIFSESFYRFNISETENTGVSVGNCSATTNDTTSHMTYEIIGDIKEFRINQSSGLIETQLPLDREVTDRYTFSVEVRDGRIPERSAFAAVEVTVNDVNDNSPVFEKDNISITVVENTSIHIIKDLKASDKDEGVNKELMYSLDNTYGDLFDIKDGVFTVNGTFDYEIQHSYFITVTAVDKGTPQRTGTAEININVVDVNDNSPVFVNDIHSYNISENKKDIHIFTANATDADSGLNGRVIYNLQNSSESPFQVDPSSGMVYLHDKLDYETKHMYTLSIIAHDLGSPQRSKVDDVIVNVIDVYDDIPAFSKDVYDVFISRAAVANTSLLNLTISLAKIHYQLSGQDKDLFRISKSSGELFLAKPINDEREIYVVQVTVVDRLNQTALCKVMVHVTGRQATFDKPEIKLTIIENLNQTSVLIDLNTTEESSPTGVVYTIVDVEPQASEKDVFTINSTTGIVSCTKALDREIVSQYVIYVSAHTPETILSRRRKREVQARSTIMKLVVNVGDVNDNPPTFTNDQERVFGVPDDVKANYIVGSVKANDPDISDDGHIRYTAVGGRTDVFGIDEDTGDIITLVAIASTRQNKFNLVISASDGSDLNEKATLNVTIFVVHTKNQPILLVNMTVAEFDKREEGLRRNMSQILGVGIQFERIESHKFSTPDGTKIDLSRTDLTFHGINKTTGLLVSNSEMKKLISDAEEELSKLFGRQVKVDYYMVDTISDPSAITATQILFICMSVFIFFGSLSALVVAQYSWTRYETENYEEMTKKTENIEKDIELSTLRSRQSSKLSSLMAAAAVNPGFIETEFITSNGRISPAMKQEPQYESQELRVSFEDDHLVAYLNNNIEETAQSAIDSGVGNTSVHSATNQLNASGASNEANDDHVDRLQVHSDIPVGTEGPVMTSSPRIRRDLRQEEKELVFTNNENYNIAEGNLEKKDDGQEERTRTSSVLLIDATGDSETDDTLEDIDNAGDSNKPEPTVRADTHIENAAHLTEASGNPVEAINGGPEVENTTSDVKPDEGEIVKRNSVQGDTEEHNSVREKEEEEEEEEEGEDECTSF